MPGALKLLFVASDVMEFRGLLRHCARMRPLGVPADWSLAGFLGDYEIALVANGVGVNRAAAAVTAIAPVFRPEAILSIGFCGALDPRLAIADIVAGTTIFAGDRRFAAESPVSAPEHRSGPVFSLDHVADGAAEKAKLYANGAIVVEMEAAGVAVRAQALSAPFFCIKTVTDLARETMDNDFNAALRSDGHFDTIKILASSLRRPWLRVPELFRLRARCMQASRSLGDFIANCRF